MTAHSGRGWQLAPSLIALEAQANRLAPRRSTASDGSIGDQAHRQRQSDHNPSGGYVHGIDITQDPRNGMDIHAHARNIAARHDGRVEYIISLGMIWERSTGRWVRYGGENPHNKHAHFSIRHTTLARYDTSPWFSGIILFPSPKPPVIVKPNPTPSPLPQPAPFPTPIPEEEDQMKLIRDHTGAIWLWGTDGSRRHIDTVDKVTAWQHLIPLIDLGPGSNLYNPIVSQVWLQGTFVR